MDNETIQKSYDVLALLATCELALDAIRKDHARADAGNICAALGVAHRLAGEVHNQIEGFHLGKGET